MARYIDADKLLNNLPDDLPYKASVKRVLIQAPSVDVVEVVRCKDCYHCDEIDGVLGKCLYCTHWNRDVDDDDYCNHGFSIKGGEE